MEVLQSSGGFIPLWILSAPLLVGVISLFMTPNPATTRNERERGYSPAARPM
jgi:type IV secretory pathway protease TraF